MIGCILVAFLLIPESPWWLASKGKVEEASQVLNRCFANVEGYDIDQQIVRVPHRTILTNADTGIGNHDFYPRSRTPAS